MERKYLGIDGGGSKTAFLLSDGKGKQLAVWEKGPGNPNDIGIDRCLAMLEEGCREVLEAAAASPGETSVFAGIAGCAAESYRLAVKDHLRKLGFGAADCRSDVENALALARMQAGNPVIAVITGTGIVAFAEKNGKRFQTAGYGNLLDDAGSGYNLGRDAIAAACRFLDGRGEKTILTETIEKKLGGDIRKNIRKFYTGGKSFIAGFAPLVFEAYRMGDRISGQILRRNAEGTAEIIRAAAAPFGQDIPPVVLCGGLCHEADILNAMLAPLLTGFKLHYTCAPMVLGAAKLAADLREEQEI